MIQLLSPEVANKIAAGEVVERPASVVRELIDNAVDADADRIDVAVEKGGLQTIEVTDNGSGMSPEDAELCIERHATSKIHEASDLDSILTKGFRGEALAAISSVSKFALKTRRPGDELGIQIDVMDGKKQPARNVGTAAGTTVTIRDLFYNTPARQKFLKKPATEMGHVISTITWNALAHEHVHFTFAHNGRRSLDYPAVNSRVERIQQIFGKEIADQLIPLQFDSPLMSISGFISRPTLTRNNAQQVYFFVNDRFIKDRILHSAMMNGYRNLLPSRRYPVVFLFYEIEPSEIDINVHPTKQEIKFSREDAIFSATYGAIREAWDTRDEAKQETQEIFSGLQKEEVEKEQPPAKKQEQEIEKNERPAEIPPEIPPSARAANETDQPAQTQVNMFSQPAQEKPAEREYSEPPKPQPQAKVEETQAVETSIEQLNRKPLPPDSREEQKPEMQEKTSSSPANGLQELMRTAKQPETLFSAKTLEAEGALKVIGQLMDSYILAEGQNGLFIIDQHAAHERLKFEEFLAKAEKTSLASQDLLFPITIDLAPDEVALIEESTGMLNQLGFAIEAFGPRTYVMRAIPSTLEFEAAEEFIKDLLGEIRNEGSAAEKKERALQTLACKAAVKFGDRLSVEDMQAIVSGMEQIPRRNVCPHGRPSILHVTDDQLRHLFKRTGF